MDGSVARHWLTGWLPQCETGHLPPRREWGGRRWLYLASVFPREIPDLQRMVNEGKNTFAVAAYHGHESITTT